MIENEKDLLLGEKIIFEIKPSKLIMIPGFVVGTFLFIFLLIMIILAWNALTTIWGGEFAVIFLMLLFITCFPFFVISWLKWRFISYILTDKRVIIKRGIIAKEFIEIPNNKIQNVYLNISILQRLVGTGSIAFSTAGESGIEGSWIWVRNPQELNRELSKHFA